MPHLAIEYTRNLSDTLNVDALMKSLHSTAQRLGVFPNWGIRTFATRIDLWQIGDDIVGDINGYVHVRVKIASGRDDATLRRIVDELHSALQRTLEPICTSQPVGYQIEIHEFNPATTRSGGSIPDQ
ncbi:5-carboxymethyl-2-hydroxymuconate isomerase (plasmid) [Rhodococcus erythropolis R138]|uniref:5-carboxymethyl-2-hydroxymuconate Delta-isomerase n=1 Tax=Rhodococcus erythropolis TaxID=1833 RepID=UPI00068F2CE9|nr:5-carboxymethyl-2-hydroxymuconate Delta-isomerase [Rhodococcus erythropolis]ALU73470.1 5-carboxymethyl-2-hydroxymuconate isomerase [Rhodococcus erythropolis R138]